eukprot:scpid112691/ scgid24546/ Histone H3.3 type c; Histone 3, variant 3 type c
MKPKGQAVKNKGKKMDKGKGSKKKGGKVEDIKEKKKFRFRPGTVALREIKRYQKSDKQLTSRAPFERRVRNTIKELDPDFRLKRSSLECMREATEAYLVN